MLRARLWDLSQTSHHRQQRYYITVENSVIFTIWTKSNLSTMTLNSTTKLSIAELAIYVVLLQPTLWLFYKHGKGAVLAFFYFTAFQILRIVAGGIQISDRNDATPSEAGAIVSSIGLSPLLLAFAGFINLLRVYYTTSSGGGLVPLISEIGVHLGAITGVALVAVGVTKIASNNPTHSDINTGRALLETGAVILLITWLALAVLCVLLLRKIRSHQVASLFMLSATTFIGVRAIYSVVYAFDHERSLSPFTGTFAVKFVFVFLIQLLAALSLFGAAFATRNAARHQLAGVAARSDVETPGSSVPLNSRSRK